MSERAMTVTRWCTVHNCPEEEPSGHCYAWLNDVSIPEDPTCKMHMPRDPNPVPYLGWRWLFRRTKRGRK